MNCLILCQTIEDRICKLDLKNLYKNAKVCPHVHLLSTCIRSKSLRSSSTSFSKNNCLSTHDFSVEAIFLSVLQSSLNYNDYRKEILLMFYCISFPSKSQQIILGNKLSYQIFSKAMLQREQRKKILFGGNELII